MQYWIKKITRGMMMQLLHSILFAKIIVPTGLLDDLTLAVEIAGPDILAQCFKDAKLNDCHTNNLPYELVAAVENAGKIFKSVLYSRDSKVTPEAFKRLQSIQNYFFDEDLNCPLDFNAALTCHNLLKRNIISNDEKPDPTSGLSYIEEAFEMGTGTSGEAGVIPDNQPKNLRGKKRMKGIRVATSGCKSVLLFVGILVLLGSIGGIAFGSYEIAQRQNPVDIAEDVLLTHCNWDYSCNAGVNLPKTRTNTYWISVSTCQIPYQCSNPSYDSFGNRYYSTCYTPGCYVPQQKTDVITIKYVDRITGKVLEDALNNEIGLGLCRVYNLGDEKDPNVCRGYERTAQRLKKKRDRWWGLVAPSILLFFVGIGIVVAGSCAT
eukprot:NODE_215_length_14308_cov_0.330987.p1 type:complete len:378 gc:universal NODE_215_length_14308_cov_0.330987:381-1514(+)